MSTSPIVTRIAPSPTGLLHVGTARTALFNYLYARKHGGAFLVRIEDTDRARSTKAYEENILEGLEILGLHADAVSRQSERLPEHRKALERLVAADTAYISTEPAKDDPTRMVSVVRLRNPGRMVTFHDEIRGDITFDTTELGDMVIARAIDDPLYHFAVVVDDADMGITHVIRGEDHISNTPRQILIQEALGVPRPIYAHLPLILAPDRSKMSKRKGAVAISDYLKDGYLPEALLNFLALMGWGDGTDQVIFTLPELIERFSLEGIHKSGAVFDIEKLNWLNREHRKLLPEERLREIFLQALAETPELQAVLSKAPGAYTDLQDRYATTHELKNAVEQGEYDFYTARPILDPKHLLWRKDPSPENTARRLEQVRTILAQLEEWSMDGARSALAATVEAEGAGNVLWPLRYALSGRERSPDPYVLLEALGKSEALERIQSAIKSIDHTSTHEPQ